MPGLPAKPSGSRTRSLPPHEQYACKCSNPAGESQPGHFVYALEGAYDDSPKKCA